MWSMSERIWGALRKKCAIQIDVYVYFIGLCRYIYPVPVVCRRQTYQKMFGDHRRVLAWTAGAGGDDVAGWHCSWCLDVDGIGTKLTSAQNGDFPRWGDYPDRLNGTYIKWLIAHGVWFDNVLMFKCYDVISGPPSLFANEHRYWKLIHNVGPTQDTLVRHGRARLTWGTTTKSACRHAQWIGGLVVDLVL